MNMTLITLSIFCYTVTHIGTLLNPLEKAFFGLFGHISLWRNGYSVRLDPIFNGGRRHMLCYMLFATQAKRSVAKCLFEVKYTFIQKETSHFMAVGYRSPRPKTYGFGPLPAIGGGIPQGSL